jgi:hypothetical protein
MVLFREAILMAHNNAVGDGIIKASENADPELIKVA